MSFTQPFSSQYMQSPPGFAPQFAATQSLNNTQPPPWATCIIDDIKSIKLAVSKIENVEKTVNNISTKLSDLENKVGSIDKRVAEAEAATTFISSQYDIQSKELRSASDSVKLLQKSCSDLNSNIKSIERDRDSVTNRLSDLEFRSMKENLIFYGIPETRPGSMESENCELLVKNMINNYLSIETDAINFDRSHRLGNTPYTSGKPRPIVVKFHAFSDREKVRTAGYAKKDELKAKELGIGVQLPKEWRDARKELYPIMQKERMNGKTVKFIGNKLYINGTLHTPASSTA